MLSAQDIISETGAVCKRNECSGMGYYVGFSPKSAEGYDGDDQLYDWQERGGIVWFYREASYRWAAVMPDGSLIDYCEGDVTVYPAAEIRYRSLTVKHIMSYLDADDEDTDYLVGLVAKLSANADVITEKTGS